MCTIPVHIAYAQHCRPSKIVAIHIKKCIFISLSMKLQFNYGFSFMITPKRHNLSLYKVAGQGQ